MATRYWVGGSGAWNASSTTNWSASSGGGGGASAPTSADDVIFNGSSDTGAGFTVTVGVGAVCNDMTVSGLDQTMTWAALGATTTLDIYGSMTLPATNFTTTFNNGLIAFRATTTGKTITLNGQTLTTGSAAFNGVGGYWTLGSAGTLSSAGGVSFLNGTFDTGNYNVSIYLLDSLGSGTRTIKLGSSTVTLSRPAAALDFSTTGTLTLDAGTSTINIIGAAGSMNGAGKTFYNVNFTSTASNQVNITGANTFNNLSFTTSSGGGSKFVSFAANQVVNGTLTFGATNSGTFRMVVFSSVRSTQRTITAAAVAALSDVDFASIAAAGASAPWSGTRIGNGLNNSGITFATPKTVYCVGIGDINGAVWALTSGGAVSADNFPLPQDTAIFDNNTNAAGASVSFSQNWYGTLDFSARTNALTVTQSSSVTVTILGNLKYSAAVTRTGGGANTFRGIGVTQEITSAGVSNNQQFVLDNHDGTVKLIDDFTTTSASAAVPAGGLDLNGKTLTAIAVSASNTIKRTWRSGGGKIVLTGNNTTVWSNTSVTDMALVDDIPVELNYSGSTGTRTIRQQAFEGRMCNFKVVAGSDTVTIADGFGVKGLDFTGFTGTLTNTAFTAYGNVTFVAGMTLSAGTGALSMGATSGNQTLTSAGKTLDFPVAKLGVGGTLQFGDNCTLASNRAFTLTSGALDLNGRVLSTGLFASTADNVRSIVFGTSKITLTGNGTTILNVDSVSNMTVTGTPLFEATYAGSTGTRNLNWARIAGGTESKAISVNVTAGTDTATIGTDGHFNNVNLTGFSGSFGNGFYCYGNMTIPAGVTIYGGSGQMRFVASSGTKTLDFGGVTWARPVTFTGAGAVYDMNSALLVDVARAATFNAGTIKFKAGTTNSAGTFVFAGSSVNQVNIQSDVPGTKYTLSQTTGTVSASYTTITDSTATGGATWQAFKTNYNIDGGNNTGWDFFAQLGKYIYTRRKNKRILL